MLFPVQFWILVAVSLVLSACGFKKFVYFMSLGYGLAVAGIGVALVALFFKNLSTAKILLTVLLVVYGFRLAGYLFLREVRSASYRKTLREASKTEKPIPAFVKVVIWLFVSIEYPVQASAIVYRFVNNTTDNVWAYIGVVVMALGIFLETLADKQKSAAKKVNPKRYCDTGLYKICRCPNYFGEITFWLGVTLSGIGCLNSNQWIVAVIGFILILYIMVSGAKRMEIRHEKNYGSDPEYIKYADGTPLLFPLLPIYHLKDVKWIK